MKSMGKRQKLVAGAFAIVTVVWVTDMLTGGAHPQKARASSSTAAEPIPLELTAAPADLEQVLSRIQDSDADPQALDFRAETRDLFLPTPQFAASVFPPPEPEPDLEAEREAAAAAEEARQAAEQVPFDERHQLEGVVSGKLRLALIDGELCAVGVVMEGYRLVEINEDSVVFEHEGDRVVLSVAPTSPVKN